VTYRDDEAARIERASVLIDEIAELERQKVIHAATDHRLEAAKHDLRTLQATTARASERPPGLITHLLVFGAAAGTTFVAYALVF
jgi:hypothetical protein